MTDQQDSGGSDFRSYLRILNRRKLIIVATVVVLVALVLAYTFVKKPVYTARAQVLVPQQEATSALSPSNNQQAPAAANLQRNLANDQQFAQGAAVKSAAQKQLGYKAKASVSASSTADILTFTASSTSPARAANIANAFANTYISEQEADQVAQYTSQVHALQTSIATLHARLPAEQGTAKAVDKQTIDTLTQSLQELEAASNLAATTSGTVIQPAIRPGSPSSPEKVRDGVLAFVVGLILGIVLAFLFERLDDTVKSFADVEEQTGAAPVLGTIPQVADWRRSDIPHLAIHEDATSAVSEAYRTLRTAVQFVSLEEPKRVIGLTSAVPDEGKTTTVANLAVSFARAGQRVIVVSFDFRKPHLHGFFGVGNDIGVTSVLLKQHTLAQAVQAVEGEPNLRVLPAGPIPPNPAEILALQPVVDLVDSLSHSADVVLVDCPPVLPVADTLLISRMVDGLLVLTRAAKTKKQDLRRTAELLRQVQAPVLGTIVNSVPQRRGYAYEYGYGYGYGGYASSQTSKMFGTDLEPAPSSFGHNGSFPTDASWDHSPDPAMFGTGQAASNGESNGKRVELHREVQRTHEGEAPPAEQ